MNVPLTPYERRIASLRTIPPAEIAILKRAQHARLSRMIAKLSECEERQMLERAAYAMARDFVSLEVGA